MARETASVRGVYERDKGTNVWWIRWTDAGGTKRREKVGRRGAAIDLLAIRKADKLQGVKLPAVGGSGLRFGSLLDDALEHSRAENGERSTQELKLKIERLRPEWGDRKAGGITKQEIVRWLQAEKERRNWTSATMNRWQAAFSLFFRVAVDNDKIPTNPASRIRRKTEDNQSIRFLTPEEESRIRAILVKKCPSCLPTFLISLHTGLRASEQWGLRWTDIDIERQTLTVRKQKSGKGERHVRLNKVALDALASLRGANEVSGVPFLNAKGTPMTTHRDWFDPAVKEAKVLGYTWHKNRHTFASRLAMAGVTIANLMGTLQFRCPCGTPTLARITINRQLTGL